jgi:hypothetical protein
MFRMRDEMGIDDKVLCVAPIERPEERGLRSVC